MRQLEDRIRHSTSSSEGVIQEKKSTESSAEERCTGVNDEEEES